MSKVRVYVIGCGMTKVSFCYSWIITINNLFCRMVSVDVKVQKQKNFFNAQPTQINFNVSIKINFKFTNFHLKVFPSFGLFLYIFVVMNFAVFTIAYLMNCNNLLFNAIFAYNTQLIKVNLITFNSFRGSLSLCITFIILFCFCYESLRSREGEKTSTTRKWRRKLPPKRWLMQRLAWGRSSKLLSATFMVNFVNESLTN